MCSVCFPLRMVSDSEPDVVPASPLCCRVTLPCVTLVWKWTLWFVAAFTAAWYSDCALLVGALAAPAGVPEAPNAASAANAAVPAATAVGRNGRGRRMRVH